MLRARSTRDLLRSVARATFAIVKRRESYFPIRVLDTMLRATPFRPELVCLNPIPNRLAAFVDFGCKLDDCVPIFFWRGAGGHVGYLRTAYSSSELI
jgi:hypothetical protein